MSDLQQLVAEVTQEVEDSGFLKEALRKAMQESMTNIANNMFRSYSTFGKALEAKMEQELILNLDKLSVASYGDVFLTQIRAAMDQTVMQAAGDKIQKLVGKYLSKLDKMDWKLSEIIDLWKKDVGQYRIGDSGQIGFVVEESEYNPGLRYVGFDEEPQDSSFGKRIGTSKSYYQMKFQLSIRPDGTLADYSVEGKNPHKTLDTTNARIYGFAAFLLALYANQATIEVDEDEVILDWNEDRD